MTVVQVVPGLPPQVDGVGAYALALGRELEARHGVSSRFVAAGTAGTAPPGGSAPADGALRVAGGDARGLTAALAATGAPAVLLHYVNYAYHRRGCPLWLLAGIGRWLDESPVQGGRRLVTLFHEVYATGPPWRSSFWLSPVQRALAARLARRSDGLATSLALYRERLARFSPRQRIAVAPVFSTVGEPAAVPPLGERARRLVVFGSAGVRRRAYVGERRELALACRALGVEEIVDVGPPLAGAPDEIDGVPVRRAGLLPEAAVSEILLGALAGFVAYPPLFLGKSTIFAAYCAHGLLPACAWSRLRGREADEPLPYWRPTSPAPSPGEMQGLADAARAWYLPHSLARQAETFRDLLAAGEGEPR